MANNKLGGAKTAKTNKRKYGRNYYKEIGALGGKVGRTGGFAYLKATGQLDKLREISSRAGKMSQRGPAKEQAW